VRSFPRPVPASSSSALSSIRRAASSSVTGRTSGPSHAVPGLVSKKVRSIARNSAAASFCASSAQVQTHRRRPRACRGRSWSAGSRNGGLLVARRDSRKYALCPLRFMRHARPSRLQLSCSKPRVSWSSATRRCAGPIQTPSRPSATGIACTHTPECAFRSPVLHTVKRINSVSVLKGSRLFCWARRRSSFLQILSY
jgi:hypothetical protein